MLQTPNLNSLYIHICCVIVNAVKPRTPVSVQSAKGEITLISLFALTEVSIYSASVFLCHD